MTLMIRQQHGAGMESGEMNTSMAGGCLTEGARQVWEGGVRGVMVKWGAEVHEHAPKDILI